MIKHTYEVSGLDTHGNKFTSECIDDDIIKAIEQYRGIHYSVHSINRKEQVNAKSEKIITVINRDNIVNNKKCFILLGNCEYNNLKEKLQNADEIIYTHDEIRENYTVLKHEIVARFKK
jgi:hypothetical protein